MSRESQPRGTFWTTRRLAWALGASAWLAVVVTLAAPGITTDEPLDVRPGRTYLETLRARGFGFFKRDVVDATFRDNAEHPPLGRWLLGIASAIGEPIQVLIGGGPDPVGIYVVSGRLAPATAFALLVALVGGEAGRRYGRPAALCAGLGLIMMPRVFAHAHLGALDTFIAFFWTWSILAANRALESDRPVRGIAIAGVVWGLALLTKIHAWLLIPVVLAWSVFKIGPRRALPAFALWMLAGFAVYFAGWPWLWYDTWHRLSTYLGTGVARISIQVLYFGQVYNDRDVPWHYPWFYFATTVPIGLHLLGGWGLVAAWRARRVDSFPFLMVGCILLLLALFSTRVAIYDGERLFLPVFPLWAILIGRGGAAAWDWARSKPPMYRLVLTLCFVTQSWGVISVHPYGLSYYNLLVGGLPGAERLGLELTYWGDAVDARLLDRLADLVQPGETVALVPTLYPGQGTVTTTRRLLSRGVILRDDPEAAASDWVLISRRTAYLSPEVLAFMRLEPPLAVTSRSGVWLAGIWRVGKIQVHSSRRTSNL